MCGRCCCCGRALLLLQALWLLPRADAAAGTLAAGCRCFLLGCSVLTPNRCRAQRTAQCDVFINRVSETWKVRVSIIVYAMCIVATVGWVLFMVFGAIGIVTLPIDWIRSWIGRPRATITRSQYIDRARDLARRAKDILALADALKREERERGRSWRWRRNAKALNTQLLALEEDEAQLELVYPQVGGRGS